MAAPFLITKTKSTDTTQIPFLRLIFEKTGQTTQYRSYRMPKTYRQALIPLLRPLYCTAMASGTTMTPDTSTQDFLALDIIAERPAGQWN